MYSVSAWGEPYNQWPTRHGEQNVFLSRNCAYFEYDFTFASILDVQDGFDHPYISFLFYGMDAAGDFIPVKQLREKYNRPRHEIPVDMNDGDGGKSTWGILYSISSSLLRSQELFQLYVDWLFFNRLSWVESAGCCCDILLSPIQDVFQQNPEEMEENFIWS